jgi:hypothetical protein
VNDAKKLGAGIKSPAPYPSSKFESTKNPEPKFRAVLTQNSAERLELVKS